MTLYDKFGEMHFGSFIDMDDTLGQVWDCLHILLNCEDTSVFRFVVIQNFQTFSFKAYNTPTYMHIYTHNLKLTQY
jgi:hypothetical protein